MRLVQTTYHSSRSGMGRRRLLGSLPLLALAVTPAQAATSELSLSCDTTLAPTLRKAADAYKARSGTQVFVFPTSPPLILPQLLRNIQNDIVVTQIPVLDQAATEKVIAAPVPARWRNPLVVAGVKGNAATDGTIAVVDPSPASATDGPALIARLGFKPTRLLGAFDTDEVAFLVATGVAQAGLLYMTDVRANDGLSVIRPVPPELGPPRLYAASITRLAQRPNPAGFIAFLGSEEATVILTGAGLEMPA